MKIDEIRAMLLQARQAYQDSLDGKSVSFTGVNGRAITNHEPAALRLEIEYWEKRYRAATVRGGGHKLARFICR